MKTIRLNEVSSTNEYAKGLADKAKEDLLIIAEKQTAGRGRMGRNFYSPEGGIYISLLLHPDSDKNPTDITVMASVAAARALDGALNTDAKIKWVNDIYVGGKKVCGILTEGSFNTENKALDYAVLGVGINLFEPDGGFPDDLRDVAGALRSGREEGLKEKIIDLFVENFSEIYNRKVEYIGEYKSRSIVLGKNIGYLKGGEEFFGKAVDITDGGELVVEVGNKRQILNSGEVKILVGSLKTKK